MEAFTSLSLVRMTFFATSAEWGATGGKLGTDWAQQEPKGNPVWHSPVGSVGGLLGPTGTQLKS